MGFNIAAAAEGDASDVANVHLRAMESNVLLHAQFPNPESLAFLREWLINDTIQHVEDDGKGVFVAKDDVTKDMASFVKWLVHGEKNSSSEDDQSETWPESCRAEYLDSYGNLTANVRKEVMRDSPYYHVTFLCTRPDHAGKGAASRLLRLVRERR